jgi:hypothetical protein
MVRDGEGRKGRRGKGGVTLQFKRVEKKKTVKSRKK